MTYQELYERAMHKKLIGEISDNEYYEMIKPLQQEVSEIERGD